MANEKVVDPDQLSQDMLAYFESTVLVKFTFINKNLHIDAAILKAAMQQSRKYNVIIYSTAKVA